METWTINKQIIRRKKNICVKDETWTDFTRFPQQMKLMKHVIGHVSFSFFLRERIRSSFIKWQKLVFIDLRRWDEKRSNAHFVCFCGQWDWKLLIQLLSHVWLFQMMWTRFKSRQNKTLTITFLIMLFVPVARWHGTPIAASVDCDSGADAQIRTLSYKGD